MDSTPHFALVQFCPASAIPHATSVVCAPVDSKFPGFGGKC